MSKLIAMIDNNYENLFSYYMQNFHLFMNVSQSIIPDPLDYFSYQRLYIGGRHLIFFTNPDYGKYFFDTVTDLGETFYKRIINSKINTIEYHIWPSIPDRPEFHGMYKYKIWNGITINIRKSNYVDVYYFGTSKDVNKKIGLANFYINNINLFESFINYFNAKVDHIINVTDSKILGVHTGHFTLQGFQGDIMSVSKQKIKKSYIKINDRNIYITPQEIKCLESLSKGYSVKFISKTLNLSPRTIESYLQKVKYKTGFNSSDLLLEWFNMEKIHLRPCLNEFS